jgi:cytochrome d ubiquinol oxidase subunit II
MDLETFWFCFIAFLWAGYFVLEGFDFGVGMLLPVLGRDEADRETMFESIGPVWDGNEVWLLVAAGVTFAAFPVWYATMTSGFYLAFLLLIVLLLLRVISFEWREKVATRRAKTGWEWINTVASVGAPLLWGIALACFLGGTPLDSNLDFAGSFADLLSPYTVLAGLAFVVLFAFHGATYLALRTLGDLRERAGALAARLAPLGLAAATAFLVWTLVAAIDGNEKNLFPTVLLVAAGIVAAAASWWFAHRRHEPRAFAATTATIAVIVVTLFVGLYPRVMVSSPSFENSLTIDNAAAGHYTLTAMTIAIAILLPIVLLYQAWTYHVFRARVGGRPVGSPADLLGPKTGE